MKPIHIKPDKRYKPGNIKRQGNTLRGNPETMQMKRLEPPAGMFVNPPIVVSRELGDKIRETLLDD